MKILLGRCTSMNDLVIFLASGMELTESDNQIPLIGAVERELISQQKSLKLPL